MNHRIRQLARNGRRIGAARPRCGTILVAAVICVLVAMLVAAGLVRAIVVQHRQQRFEEQRLQALWLAESAAGRAADALRADAGYTGEDWRLPIAEVGAEKEASAMIRVEPLADRPNERLVRIEARWPDDPVRRGICHKELVIQLPGEGDSP